MTRARELRARVKPVLDALAESGLADTATVVLVGSAARGAMNARSDIDVLVLHCDGRRIRLRRSGDIHLQQDSRPRFLQRLEDGDDYPGWALRLGIPVRDPDKWWATHAAAESVNPHWPKWHAKVSHAGKRHQDGDGTSGRGRRRSSLGGVTLWNQPRCPGAPTEARNVPVVATGDAVAIEDDRRAPRRFSGTSAARFRRCHGTAIWEALVGTTDPASVEHTSVEAFAKLGR